MIIRAVTAADFAQWAPLWDGYNTFYQRTLPAEITETTWARFLDDAEPIHALVADDDGALVGLAHYVFHRSTTLIGPTCYLSDVFTDLARRGAGIGRALIEAVYERAATGGANRVYWQTHESNAVAMKLYDKIATRSGFLVYRKLLGERG